MKGIVLDKVLKNTKKVGFNASILELMNFKDPKVRSEILDDSKIFEFVDKGKIEKLFKINKMTNSYSKFLFAFVSSKLFMDAN
jgi:asparagine synthase (glutamine-hydrolysing)